MTRKMGVRWHLRELMATRGMFSTTDLIGPLAERGVELSREQVYRLVTQQPERLNVYTLAAGPTRSAGIVTGNPLGVVG